MRNRTDDLQNQYHAAVDEAERALRHFKRLVERDAKGSAANRQPV